MPTYEYKCSRCGHQFEQFQRITEPPRKLCPKCRGSVKRLIGGGGGLIFKGSGFYSTDYRSSAYRTAAKADAAKASPPAASSGGDSGGSKPAPAAPAAPAAPGKSAK
jgi:putative FmdB family regulatory protein